MARTEGRRWLKYGCLGCLAFVGVAVLLVGSIVGVALLQARTEKIEDVVKTHDVPAGPAVRPADVPAGPGRVRIELANGGIRVEPAAPGEPLRLEASYDTKSFELDERLDTESRPWSYELRFHPRGSALIAGLKTLFSGRAPELHVYLPVDAPLDLELDVQSGGGEFELGGLWLRSLDAVAQKGGFDLRVSQPLREPMERLRLRGSMGGMSTSRLGNASPAELSAEFHMGGADLDLRGAWVRDSQVTIRARMGGTSVRLPRNVVIRGLDRGVSVEPDPEVPLPTLTFSVSAQMGDIEFLD